MTREEAIAILQKRITARYCCVWEKISDTTFWAEPDEVNAALDMAIAALREQETLTQPQNNLTQWISAEESAEKPIARKTNQYGNLVCLHNEGVVCETPGCEQCGWNPEVQERRRADGK